MNRIRQQIIKIIAETGTLAHLNEWETIADAMINKLGLRPEWGSLDEEDGGVLADTREELKTWPGETVKRRYITPWTVPDE